MEILQLKKNKMFIIREIEMCAITTAKSLEYLKSAKTLKKKMIRA